MENFSLRRAPFLVPLVGLAIGISGWIFLGLLLFLLPRGYWLFFSIFLGLGYFLNKEYDERSFSNHFHRYWKEGNYVLMEVGSGRVHKVKGLLGVDGCGIPVRGKIGWNGGALKVGGLYWIKGSIRSIPKVDNEYSFNYQKWMAYKNVHYEWKTIEEVREVGENSFVAGSERLRKLMLSQFKKVLDEENSLALVSALILGLRAGMPEEMKSDYVKAGAIHVMAVSGLHVGIVYAIADKILGFLATRWRKLAIIPLIWGFGYLTGSAAAVKRAAGMFTWYSFGESHPINTIAGTAFILLIFNPYLLFDLGFQLSFSAVIGILVIHPFLNTQLKFKQKGLKYLWDLTTVGIGAQLTTLPFILYYFNQLPTYFWLSGWLVVPAAAGILFLGLVAVILPYEFIGFPLRWLVKITNEGVFWIAGLPGSVIENLHIDLIQACLIGLVVGGVFFKKFKWLWVLAIITLYSGYDMIKEIKREGQYRLIMDYSAMEVWVGKTAYSFLESKGNSIEKFRGVNRIQKTQEVEMNTQLTIPGKICIEKRKEFIYGEIWGKYPLAFRVMDATTVLKTSSEQGIIYITGWVEEDKKQRIYNHCDCWGMDCRILKSVL